MLKTIAKAALVGGLLLPTVDPKFDAAGGGTIKSQFQSNNIMIGAHYAF